MMYTVCVTILNTINVDASSEEDAINKVKSNLINTKQIKQTDPVTFSIAKEVDLEDSKHE